MKRQTIVKPETEVFDPNKEVPQITDDVRGLERLEQVFRDNHRTGIAALRTIRDKKLYVHKNYKTFKDYILNEWNRTPQWATQEFHFLRVVEIFERRWPGKEPYRGGLRKEWAQHLVKMLAPGDLDGKSYDAPASTADTDEAAATEMILAFQECLDLERTTRQQVKGSMVEMIVKRRLEYVEFRKDVHVELKDFLAVRELPEDEYIECKYRTPVTNFVIENSTACALEEACRKHRAIPARKALVKVFACEELQKAVAVCLALVKTWKAEDEARKTMADVKGVIRLLRPENRQFDRPEVSEDQFRMAVRKIVEHLPDAARGNLSADLERVNAWIDTHIPEIPAEQDGVA